MATGGLGGHDRSNGGPAPAARGCRGGQPVLVSHRDGVAVDLAALDGIVPPVAAVVAAARLTQDLAAARDRCFTYERKSGLGSVRTYTTGPARHWPEPGSPSRRRPTGCLTEKQMLPGAAGTSRFGTRPCRHGRAQHPGGPSAGKPDPSRPVGCGADQSGELP